MHHDNLTLDRNRDMTTMAKSHAGGLRHDRRRVDVDLI